MADKRLDQENVLTDFDYALIVKGADVAKISKADLAKVVGGLLGISQITKGFQQKQFTLSQGASMPIGHVSGLLVLRDRVGGSSMPCLYVIDEVGKKTKQIETGGSIYGNISFVFSGTGTETTLTIKNVGPHIAQISVAWQELTHNG